MNTHNGTVVLVHGAWADGSCWQNVILPLERLGLKVICAPLPLTSLTDDIAALSRTIERTDGPVVLVGHAYAGAVIAGPADDRIKALVYVSALAPGEDETVAQVFYREPTHPEAPQLAPDAHGFIWMPEDGFRKAVAHKASADQTAIMAERMGAKIRSYPVDHTAMYTEPNVVVDVIGEAVRETLSVEISARRTAS